MSIKIINISKKKQALEFFSQFKNKNYGNAEIKIENLHIRNLNAIPEFELFKKNDAYINASVLYKILNNGVDDTVNYHGLSESQLYDALVSIKTSACFFKTKKNRYAILTNVILPDGDPILVIIEINANLKQQFKIKINKIVTVYPKRNIKSYINSHNGKDMYKK